MRHFSIFLIFTSFSFFLQAQGLLGAWEGYHEAADGTPVKSVLIFSEGHQVVSTYNAKTGAFLSTNGGTWKLEEDTMIETVEFDTENPERVGSEVKFKIIKTDSTLQAVGRDMILNRVDNGLPGQLSGAWLMSGRIRNGETQNRDTSRPRKTMKILSGTRFQWIAYNTETKEFKGTGGGTYTTVDGKYTETIKFFSRDDSRVGADLEFDFELMEGHWHHSGLSSKGKPIHEIWSPRE